MFNNLDLAYLGGLMDGEGCIQFQTRNFHSPKGKEKFQISPRITLGNTNMTIMENVTRILKEEMEVGHNIQDFPGAPRKKPSRTIGIVGYKRCFRFLRAIEPYLVGKRENARIVLAFCWSRLKLGSRYGHIPYSPDEMNLVNRIKDLNHRGDKLEILNEHTLESVKKYTDMMCSELQTKAVEVEEILTRRTIGFGQKVTD